MKPRIGRPPKPARERQARHIRVPVNDAEGAVLDAWAQREGRPLAALMRTLALRAARRGR